MLLTKALKDIMATLSFKPVRKQNMDTSINNTVTKTEQEAVIDTVGKKATIAIYGIGGTGINITRLFKHDANPVFGVANINITRIDTSLSNSKNDVVIVGQGDGGGKDPKFVAQTTEGFEKEILHKHQPGDYNIVVHGGGGATGPGFSLKLVKELLSRDKNVMVFMTESSSSAKEIENVINTLKSYQKIQKITGKPIVIAYDDSKEEAVQDKNMLTRLAILSILLSGENNSLDKKDIENFLGYHKVTSVDAGLVLLGVCSGKITEDKVVATATIAIDASNIETGVTPAYRCHGIITPEARKQINTELPIHAFLVANYFPTVVSKLEKKLQDIKEGYGTFKMQELVIDEDDLLI